MREKNKQPGHDQRSRNNNADTDFGKFFRGFKISQGKRVGERRKQAIQKKRDDFRDGKQETHECHVLAQQNQTAEIQKQKIIKPAAEKAQNAAALQAQRVVPKTRRKKKVKTRPAEFRIQTEEAAHRTERHHQNEAQIRSPNDSRIVLRQHRTHSYKQQDINYERADRHDSVQGLRPFQLEHSFQGGKRSRIDDIDRRKIEQQNPEWPRMALSEKIAQASGPYRSGDEPGHQRNAIHRKVGEEKGNPPAGIIQLRN